MRIPYWADPVNRFTESITGNREECNNIMTYYRNMDRFFFLCMHV